MGFNTVILIHLLLKDFQICWVTFPDVSAIIKWPTLADWSPDMSAAPTEATTNVVITPAELDFATDAHVSTIAPGIAAIGIEK